MTLKAYNGICTCTLKKDDGLRFLVALFTCREVETLANQYNGRIDRIGDYKNKIATSWIGNKHQQ